MKWIVTLALLCTLASCSIEKEQNHLDGGREATVTFAIEVPEAAQPVNRSLSTADEGYVSTVDVMVFAAGQYRFTQAAYNVTSVSNSKKTFEVKLPLGNWDLTVIANGRSAIQAGGFVQGEAKATVLNALERSLPAGTKWTSNQLVMWGRRDGVTIDENSSLTGANTIKMTRMLSKIEVLLEEAAAGTNNSNFAITSVRLYNYNTAGKLVPNLSSGWDEINHKAITPNLAAIPGKTYGPLVYTAADDYTGNFFTANSVTNTIYTFEAAAGEASTPLSNICVVVGGSYCGSGSETHFYRMDFIKNSNCLPLLRNHNYIFRVHTITGPGFPTPEEAFSAGPVNIEADLLPWNEGDLTHVIFDGQFILSVNQDRFEFYRDGCYIEEYDNVLEVFTDYKNSASGAVSGWYIEKIVNPVTDARIQWLTVTPNQGAPDNRTKVVLTYSDNNTGVDRDAVIWIVAGRLRYPIHVTQYRVSHIGLSIVHPIDHRPINELLFISPIGVEPDAQQFKVIWSPHTAPLSVEATTCGSAPFPLYAGGPIPPVVSGAGSHTFTVQPPALTQGEIDADPLLDKSTRFDFFVNSGPSMGAATIFLRQVHYNLVATPESSYLLDGGQKTLLVKSNTAWRIKQIEETSSDPSKNILAIAQQDNLQVGLTGGYNTTGEAVTFTVANDRTFWGKVQITFESTEFPKLFEDKVVTLIFALPNVKVTGIGTYGGSYGYNPTAPGDSPYSAYYMLTATNNFGVNEHSTVYSRGFSFTTYDTGLSDTQLQDACDNSDIVIVTYSFRLHTPTRINILANLTKQGGVLLLYNEISSDLRDFMNAIFEVNTINAGAENSGGAIYQINNNVNDLVTNGPFGDLRGKHWGEDNSATACVFMPSMPANSLTCYTTAANHTNGGGNANYATSFRLNDYPMFFLGDGGTLSSGTSTSNTICPFRLDSQFAPIPKSFYGSYLQFDIYNSAFFANLMVWAITQTGR